MKNEFSTLDQVKKMYNTTKLTISGKLVQVKHHITGIFHYLEKTETGWEDTGVTSIKPEFFNGEK